MRLITLLLTCMRVMAAQPTVLKVDPPNWWTRSTLSPVRLLIRGTNLAGATVTGDLHPAHFNVNPNGTYLFVDVTPDAVAGSHPLTIHTAQGTTSAPFELLEPLPPPNRFAGLSSSDVIYLIMPDRFANGDISNDDPAISRGLFDRSKARSYHGGDLRGVRDHLAYLKQLGVTAIWLTPWYDNADRISAAGVASAEQWTDYHGYGAIDFYGVEEHFGTLADLRALVEAAHAQGIKIVQDEVANHTGPFHPWVIDPPTPTWFHGTTAHHIIETWQLWPLIDPHASESLKSQTLDGWFADVLPDLNQDDPEVARYLTENTLWWIGITGLDAIRMDTLPYVPRSFWHDWMAAITREYASVNVIGEVFNGDPAITSFFPEGALSVFDFPDYFKARDVFLKGKPIRELAGMLGHDGLYKNPERLGTFIGNHDVARFMSEPGASVDKLKLAFTWLLTTRGVPTIYYGDEVAMRGGDDPDNRHDFPEPAFVEATRTAEQQAVWSYVADLARLRKQFPALSGEVTNTVCATENQWVYTRWRFIMQKPAQKAVIEINNAATPAQMDCPMPGTHWRTVLGPGHYGEVLPPYTARISEGGATK